jgi:hypothetical protein
MADQNKAATPREMAIAQAVRQACCACTDAGGIADDVREAMGDINLSSIIATVTHAAAPAVPAPVHEQVARDAIGGAIAYGRMGVNPPPSPDHWLNEYWQIGRQLAKLGETSAWDNVTPADNAPAVPAVDALTDEWINENLRSFFSYSGNKDNLMWASTEDIQFFARAVERQVLATPTTAPVDPEQAKLDSLAQAGLAAALENHAKGEQMGGTQVAAQPRATEQAADDPVVEANRQLLLDRSRIGISKYGVTLASSGLSRTQLAQHALEEALDLANYLQGIIQTDTAQQAAPEAPAAPATGAQVAKAGKMARCCGRAMSLGIPCNAHGFDPIYGRAAEGEATERKPLTDATDPASWVPADQLPSEGLYVALYRNAEERLILAVCAYGEYDAYDEDSGDWERRTGWSESVSYAHGELSDAPRVVITYLPQNYDLASLAEVRQAIEQQSVIGGAQ